MLQQPFNFLAAMLLGTLVFPIFLPFSILIVGYPSLILIAIWFAGRWLMGYLERPAEMVAVWTAYLGLILIVHGIVICFDTSLAGAPPTIEEKRFGTRLAYLGGALAGVSVLAAYVVDLRRRAGLKRTAKSVATDELII